MPVYGFQCRKCGDKFSVLLSISEKGKAACPRCQAKDLNEDFSGYGSAGVPKSSTQNRFT